MIQGCLPGIEHLPLVRNLLYVKLARFSGGRHAFSLDAGRSWSYSPFDAYNGTVEWLASSDINPPNDDVSTSNDGNDVDHGSSIQMELEVEELYLRARPHLLLDDHGQITHLSTGARPTKQSDYVYTLVVPVLP